MLASIFDIQDTAAGLMFEHDADVEIEDDTEDENTDSEELNEDEYGELSDTDEEEVNETAARILQENKGGNEKYSYSFTNDIFTNDIFSEGKENLSMNDCFN